MTDAKTYAPGAIASFFAKNSSDSTAALKEHGQLRVLFDSPNETKSRKRQKAVSFPELSRNSKKLKEADGSVEGKQNKDSEKKIRARDKGMRKGDQDNKKSRKREIDDSNSSGHEPKRFKGDASAVREDSTPDSKVDTKQETKSLSKNELNAKRRVDFKLKKEILKEQKPKDERTIFVGNVALTVTKKMLIRLFKQFGKVEAVRIRSVPVAPSVAPEEDSKKKSDKVRQKFGKKSENDGFLSMSDLNDAEEKEDKTKKPKRLPKKALVIMREFDPNRHSMNAYVVFEKEESAQLALQLNGTEVEGLHIRVDMAGMAKKQDHKLTIFVGNLPFGVEEEDVRKHFDVCGEIENVRIIRDKFTGTGKGFGYVKFTEKSSCNLALSIDGQELLGRPLRIKKAAKKMKIKKAVPAAKGFSAKKTKFTEKNQRRGNPRQEQKKKKKGQLSRYNSAKEAKLKPEAAVPRKNKLKKPIQKFGDVKHRLQSMKMNTKSGRKEKHGLKKAMREMIRERKKVTLGKLLTGGKNK